MSKSAKKKILKEYLKDCQKAKTAYMKQIELMRQLVSVYVMKFSIKYNTKDTTEEDMRTFYMGL